MSVEIAAESKTKGRIRAQRLSRVRDVMDLAAPTATSSRRQQGLRGAPLKLGKYETGTEETTEVFRRKKKQKFDYDLTLRGGEPFHPFCSRSTEAQHSWGLLAKAVCFSPEDLRNRSH